MYELFEFRAGCWTNADKDEDHEARDYKVNINNFKDNVLNQIRED